MIRRVLLSLIILPASIATGQEKSVNPKINKSFEDPNVDDFLKRFETESREVYKHRQKIVDACNVKAGMTVADIGAGTGLMTRLFSKAVGPDGKVLAVDIAPRFLEHIEKRAREDDMTNIKTVLCDQQSTNLPRAVVDIAFVCDTYHHFEFPQRTLASLMNAIKPGGALVVVDFYRREGISRPFIMNHVRADRDVFVKEVVDAGFEPVADQPRLPFLKENYFVRFRRPIQNAHRAVDGAAGGVVCRIGSQIRNSVPLPISLVNSSLP